MLISPSILSVFSDNLESSLKILEEVKADFLHIDVMDNIFVPNQTFNYEFVKEIKLKTNLIFDTHLMIYNPDEDYLKYIEAGSDMLTFHYEASSNPLELLKKIKKENVKAGISIKPETDVRVLDELLPYVDLILVMSVEPGFGGQPFKDSAIKKIEYLDKVRKEKKYQYLIEVDGGINDQNAKLVKSVGCDIIVVGSFLMKSNSVKDTYKKLKNI